MASYSILNAETQLLAIGKAAVFYGTGAFGYVASPTGADLTLTALGLTEGEISIELNDSYSTLSLPEYTGEAPREKYLEGYAPVVTIPLIAADDALRAIVSPTGSGHGGYRNRRAVTEYVLALIPEQVFFEANVAVAVEFTNTAGTGAWEVGGDAATADQEALLDLSIFFWRGHFTATPPAFRHEDGGKSVQEVQFHAMHNSSMPDGHHLFTIGRPDEATPSILIDETA
jgi:hypothetical protein